MPHNKYYPVDRGIKEIGDIKPEILKLRSMSRISDCISQLSYIIQTVDEFL